MSLNLSCLAVELGSAEFGPQVREWSGTARLVRTPFSTPSRVCYDNCYLVSRWFPLDLSYHKIK